MNLLYVHCIIETKLWILKMNMTIKIGFVMRYCNEKEQMFALNRVFNVYLYLKLLLLLFASRKYIQNSVL